MMNWSQAQLAEGAKVSRMTIVDFEKETRVPHQNNLAAIRAALEAAGIEFIEQNGGRAGGAVARGIKDTTPLLGVRVKGCATRIKVGRSYKTVDYDIRAARVLFASLDIGTDVSLATISALRLKSNRLRRLEGCRMSDDPRPAPARLPMAHFGKVGTPLPDYREVDDPDPDDEELAVTPPDVVMMLGFDPLDDDGA